MCLICHEENNLIFSLDSNFALLLHLHPHNGPGSSNFTTITIIPDILWCLQRCINFKNHSHENQLTAIACIDNHENSNYKGIPIMNISNTADFCCRAKKEKEFFNETKTENRLKMWTLFGCITCEEEEEQG